MSDDKRPGGGQEERHPAAPPRVPLATAPCRRCGTPGPVGDDGFCERCEKALEQACL